MLQASPDHRMHPRQRKQVGKQNRLTQLQPSSGQDLVRVSRRRQLPAVSAEKAPRLTLAGQTLDESRVRRGEQDLHLVSKTLIVDALTAQEGISSDFQLLGVQLATQHGIMKRTLLKMLFKPDLLAHDRSLHKYLFVCLQNPSCAFVDEIRSKGKRVDKGPLKVRVRGQVEDPGDTG